MKSTIVIILGSLVLLFGCSKSQEDYSTIVTEEVAVADDAAAMAQPEAKSLYQSAEQSPEKTRTAPLQRQNKIIRTGSLSIESKDITASKKTMDQLVKNIGGYYEQENTSTGADYTSYDLTVRIPHEKFDSFISSIEIGRDKVTNKSIHAEDVSLQYYDLESRLKSKRTYLDRYQKMVAGAKSVKDLLEIEEQIRQLQEDIESTESTLRNLSGQVNYSTLQVNLFEYRANLPIGSNSFWVQISDAFTSGWHLIQYIFLGLIGVWPVLILIAGGVFLWKRWRKKKKISVHKQDI